MTEGLNVVLVGIIGVFGNLLILMVLIMVLGRVVRAKAPVPEDKDEKRGKAVA